MIVCTIPCIVLPIVPEILRNIRTFGAISSPIAGQRQLVGTLNPFCLVVNAAKNFVFNLPTTYWKGCEKYLQKIPNFLAGILGVDINDPAIAEDGRIFSLHGAPNFGHDTAINPVIVWLLILCIIWAVIKIRHINWRQMYRSYSLVAVICFVAFCAVLRWEPFVTRYMVSFLALLCPMIVFQIQRLTEVSAKKPLRLQNILVGIICLVCVIDIINIGEYHQGICNVYGAAQRPYGYFVNRSNEYEAYSAICQAIADNGYQQIGLFSNEDHYEYPFWAMLQENDVQIRHVNVQNESAIYTDEEYVPDCIIWLGTLEGETFTWNGAEYTLFAEYEADRYLLIRM